MNFVLSFYSTCMNRLWQLRQTLDYNLEICKRKNYQLCLVNYNSKDGLDEFINQNYMDYIKNKTLKYFYTKDPEYFDASKAKNLAARLTDGQVVFSLDGDNFINEIESDFLCSPDFLNSNNFYHGEVKFTRQSRRDSVGRIACKRDDFFKINGYDEKMIGIDNEDYDLINRLKLINLKRVKAIGQGYKIAINNSKKDKIIYCQDFHMKHNYYNRIIRDDNLDKKIAVVNPDGFKKFVGILNFEEETVI